MTSLQVKGLSASRPLRAAIRPTVARKPVICKAQKDVITPGQKAATAALTAMLTLGTVTDAAIASEFDILAEPTPTESKYVFDDANVLSKSTRADLTKRLKILEIGTGYHVNVVTVRKLEFETDPFAYGDKVLENWYPTAALGDKKGVVLMVSSGKEAAVSGGPSFMDALGDDLIESIVSDNVPIYAEQERYNLAMESTIERVEAKLNGKEVPAGPERENNARKRNFKTKEETEKAKSVTGSVVATLLIIAFVVPMLQYYGYTAKD